MLKNLYRWWILRRMRRVETQMESLLKAGFALMPEDKEEYELLERKYSELDMKLR